MRTVEGLRVSLLEESMLDSAGILSGPPGSSVTYGLPDTAIQLFLLVASAGEHGLTQSRIPKEFRERLNEYLLPLELQNLVVWERDNRGRLAYLVLTWKGQEAWEAARTAAQLQPANTIAAKRRAAVQTPRV